MGALRVMVEGLRRWLVQIKATAWAKALRQEKSCTFEYREKSRIPEGERLQEEIKITRMCFHHHAGGKSLDVSFVWCCWRWSLLWTQWSWFSYCLGRLKLNISFCPSSHRRGGHRAVHQHGGESLLRDAGRLGEHEGEAILNGSCRSGVCSSRVPSPPPRWPRLSEPLP